jgi:acetyl-CoA acetyltransferase
LALIAHACMLAMGATRQGFGKLVLAQRANAQRNPLALLRGEMTVADYLPAGPIAVHHHLVDCLVPVPCGWLPRHG